MRLVLQQLAPGSLKLIERVLIRPAKDREGRQRLCDAERPLGALVRLLEVDARAVDAAQHRRGSAGHHLTAQHTQFG